MASYIPPSASTAVASVAASTSWNKADAELARVVGNLRMESKEAAAQRRQAAQDRDRNHTILSSTVAGMAMATAIMAIYVEASVVVYLAFIFPLVMAPTVIHQRRRLNKLPTLVEELNDIRLRVNDLAVQNNRLHGETTKLKSQVQALTQVERQFERVVTRNGKSVTEFKTLATENGEITRQMKMIQETQVMQQLLQAVLTSDENRDFQLNEAEIDRLVVRLKLLKGVKRVDSTRLRAVFRASNTNSMMTLYKLTADLLEEGELEISKASSRSSV